MMETEMILFLIMLIVVLLGVTVFIVLTYSGLFAFPTVRTDRPPIDYGSVFAYQFLRGSYSSNDVGATFTLATSIAPKAPSIGIFYDDPTIVPENELRCAVGCLISREEIERAEDDTNDEDEVVDDAARVVVTRPLVDESERAMLEKKEFKFCPLPRIQQAVVTEFPYTTPFSIWLAPNKVYPRLGEYIQDRNLCAYPMIELYADNQVRYMCPLSKQDDFFVPEAKEERDDEQTPGPSVEKAKSEPAVRSVDVVKEESIALRPDDDDDQDSSNVRRRRNVPNSSTNNDDAAEEEKTTTKLPQPTESGTAKRKDSSQSSSSFEEIGVEEL